jgi:hypothetical protein
MQVGFAPRKCGWELNDERIAHGLGFITIRQFRKSTTQRTKAIRITVQNRSYMTVRAESHKLCIMTTSKSGLNVRGNEMKEQTKAPGYTETGHSACNFRKITIRYARLTRIGTFVKSGQEVRA